MENLHTNLVELLSIVLPIIALVAFIIMDIFSRIKALFDAKNNIIAQRDAELENLRVENANLTAQLAQYAGVNEVSAFLTEQGF